MMKYLAILIAGLMAGATLNAADLAKAKATYEKKCAKCHGKDGKGQTTMGKRLKARDYTRAETWAKVKDEEAFKAVKEGLKKNGKTRMHPIKGLSDQEIKDLIAYMKTFKKN
ncbi:MAG: cytochrome c [Verrucomicrobia bacterium]|nr:MAG: cytochrome c [Verrucomicrobiota bacterium]